LAAVMRSWGRVPRRKIFFWNLYQCFHPYLMKYLVMICRGHVPKAGHGSNPFFTNKDVLPFLMFFLPKGQKPGHGNLSKAAKTLHLAFKGMETEEVYDILMTHLISAINGYDPHHKRKVKLSPRLFKMHYRRGNNSQTLTSTATWTLIAIAISACWCALASSERLKKAGAGRRIVRHPSI
jgi:hypothetical protein